MDPAALVPLATEAEIPQWFKDNEKKTINGKGKVMINHTHQHPKWVMDAWQAYNDKVEEMKALHGEAYNQYNWNYVPTTGFKAVGTLKTQAQIDKAEKSKLEYLARRAEMDQQTSRPLPPPVQAPIVAKRQPQRGNALQIKVPPLPKQYMTFETEEYKQKIKNQQASAGAPQKIE